jgi:hypothetical protein
MLGFHFNHATKPRDEIPDLLVPKNSIQWLTASSEITVSLLGSDHLAARPPNRNKKS